MRLFLQRAGLVVAIAGIAVLCLSSPWLAAAVGIITAAIVTVDMIVFSRAPRRSKTDAADDPERINVDLSRRR